jgi:hypothetical protein
VILFWFEYFILFLIVCFLQMNMEIKRAQSDPPREQEQEQQEVKQPKQRLQPLQPQQQQAPATDRRSQKSAVKRPRHENPGSADAQKRYSEKLLSVQRKLFLLADAWNVELVLLVGGRTVDPAFSSFRPGALTEWMLSNQAAASIAKFVADKPKQSGGSTFARSDEFTQGKWRDLCAPSLMSAMFVRLGQCPSVCMFFAWGRLSRSHARCRNPNARAAIPQEHCLAQGESLCPWDSSFVLSKLMLRVQPRFLASSLDVGTLCRTVFPQPHTLNHSVGFL